MQGELRKNRVPDGVLTMVCKGQFLGLDWNRIARLHSQVMMGTYELTNNIALSH